MGPGDLIVLVYSHLVCFVHLCDAEPRLLFSFKATDKSCGFLHKLGFGEAIIKGREEGSSLERASGATITYRYTGLGTATNNGPL